MSNKKTFNDMHEKIKDVITNLAAIKGDKFAEASMILFLSSHSTSMLGALMEELPEGLEHARDAVQHQLAYTMAKAMSCIATLNDFSPEDMAELMQWSDTMQAHVKQAMRESS